MIRYKAERNSRIFNVLQEKK